MENWIWGLSLIALTMAIHGSGVLWIAVADAGMRGRIERQNRLSRHHVSGLVRIQAEDRAPAQLRGPLLDGNPTIWPQWDGAMELRCGPGIESAAFRPLTK